MIVLFVIITQDKNIYKNYDQFFQLWLEREVLKV